MRPHNLESRDGDSLEDFKVSSSDVNENSLLKPNNLNYEIDDKENSILNHPNVMRSIQSNNSKNEKTTGDEMELSKSKSKSSNNLQISNFLGSISKMDDDFKTKIAKYLQVNQNSASSNFNDSKNHRDLESMLKTHNQSHIHKLKENAPSSPLHSLLDAEESFLKSMLKSSSKRQKRTMIRELLKHKNNPALKAKAKLLLSSYYSEESDGREDDLRFSQTKMDEIMEVDGEEGEIDRMDSKIGGNWKSSRNGGDRYLDRGNKMYTFQRDEEDVSPRFTPEM